MGGTMRIDMICRYRLSGTGSRCRSWTVGAAFWAFVIAFCPHFATAASYPSLVDTPTLVIDQNNNGTAIIALRNSSRTGLKKGVLSARDFVSQTTRQPLGAKITLSASGEPGAMPISTLSDLAPGGTQLVKVEVSNLWQAGESNADLEYDGVKIGILKALKYVVPFTVSLQSPTPDNPTVIFKKGQTGSLTFKNDDAMTYLVGWELEIGGKKVIGPALLLPAKGTVTTDLCPVSEWFAWYRGLFREDLQDGRLTLRALVSSNQNETPLQVKTVPLKACLLYWSPFTQQLLSTGVIFFVLAMGGSCSLVVSYWVPNRLRRRDLIEQLAKLVVKIRALSQQIDSTLRVLVRVQHQRLLKMLFARWTLSPDCATVFSQCARGIATLNRQVTLLDKIDTIYDQLKKAEAESSPPSLLDGIEEQLKKAAESLCNLEPQEADFQAAQGLIDLAGKKLTALNQADPLFAKELVDRMKELVIDLDPESGKLAKTRKFQELRHKLTTLFDELDQKLTDPAGIRISDYVQLDTSTSMLMVIRDYLEISGSFSPPQHLEDKLMKHLRHRSRQELREVQQLVQQMREGIFAEDIKEAILSRDEPPKILMDPAVARLYLPACFSVTFPRKALDRAAALDEFECEWDFGHEDLHEAGCKVSHYFPQLQTYQVKISFKDSDGHSIKDSGNNPVTTVREIKVQPDPAGRSYDRLVTESLYLAIVLFAALLGLIGGAQEQLAKMDLIPGLIGVFVLGFTADQIKKLLTQRAPSGEQRQ